MGNFGNKKYKNKDPCRKIGKKIGQLGMEEMNLKGDIMALESKNPKDPRIAKKTKALNKNFEKMAKAQDKLSLCYHRYREY